MFLLNSRLGLVSATASSSICTHFTAAAPLLPKLRGQLAEFLGEGYLVRLSLLSQPTCVGLRYGRPIPSLEAFLGNRASMTSPPLRRIHVRSQGYRQSGFAWTVPLLLCTGFSITRST